MKAGYRIGNEPISEVDNCIAVYNYHYVNSVCNLPIDLYFISLFKKDKSIIGIWKIKSLKN